ncbi:MAG: DNA polymerase III subunit beta [Symploca sp. SIO2E9]|nr:DNA polymerase III subunit beta [Symploca sp. SIO2E9]
MKFCAAVLAFKEALSLVARAVPKQPTHPILGNLLLTGSSEQIVTVTGFDLSIGIVASFSAEVLDPGSVTVPVKLLTKIVSNFVDGEVIVECSQEDLVLVIRTNSGKYQVNGLDAADFPELPKPSAMQLHIQSEVLRQGLVSTLFAAELNEVMHALCGVHCKFRGNEIELASTNGHILALAVLEQDIKNATEEASVAEATIPTKALNELLRILGKIPPEEILKIYIQEGQVLFQVLDIKLLTRIYSEQYPMYEKLIPQQFERKITVDRLLLLSAIEGIAAIASYLKDMLWLAIDSEKQVLTIWAKADIGNAVETIPVKSSGESLQIAFNARYLKKALRVMSSSEVEMLLNGNQDPVIITPTTLSTNTKKAVMLLMPLQAQADST